VSAPAPYLSLANDLDLEAVAALVNSAYRGESSRAGWTTEADFLGGQRTDPQTLWRDLEARPGAVILTLRDEPDSEIIACVWLEPAAAGAWYLGMLTVRPTLQDRRLGRTLLEAAEVCAAERGARRMRLTVISIRTELIAWYERRGYVRTGETQPFPADDPLFGVPSRDDLEFVVLDKTLGED
jgi:ribosomal protein S18 acetylase RimI-like enzyme